MSARGDLLRPLRLGAIIVPIVAGVLMLCVWMRWHPLAPRFYLIGLFVVGVGGLLTLLPRIDSSYRQVYWLGSDRYEIPWQYSPFNGSTDRGGKYFLIKVSVPGLVPRYEAQGETFIIGKAVDFNHGKGGSAPAEVCKTNYSRLECQWQRDASVFIASGNANILRPNISALMPSVADLLDSFKVSAP